MLNLKRKWLIFGLAVIAVLVIFYFLGFVLPEETEPIVNNNQPAATSILPVEFLPGEVGEQSTSSSQAPPVVGPTLPDIVSSTAGIIIEITDSYALLQGNGGNFADGLSRELKCIFADNFVILDQARQRHQLLDGLKLLQKGTEVLVDGVENLRGKTEFEIGRLRIIN